VKPLRHLLLVAVIACAQWVATAHAVEHAAGDGKGLPSHTCELCLAAHDLGAALPSAAALPALPAPVVPPLAAVATGRPALPAPSPVQRGPPAA
jgi:tetrahydromethanopterin S-methyltransferase subunit C